MKENDFLIQKLEEEVSDVFWQGKTSVGSIKKLSEVLHSRLPVSFQRFLEEHGGGGVIGEEISGIEDDDPSLEYRGTVLGDTIQCRANFSLPANLIVIYFGSDDIVWCLDTASFTGDECPVVSFDVFTKATKHLANTFEEFLTEYLKLRIAGA